MQITTTIVTTVNMDDFSTSHEATVSPEDDSLPQALVFVAVKAGCAAAIRDIDAALPEFT